MIQNSKFKIQNSRKGFSLIELIVAMFILAMVIGAMVAVSVAVFRSQQKSRAIKTVTENISFALNTISKDVRMGMLEDDTASNCLGSGINNLRNCVMVTRNKKNALDEYYEKVCYRIDAASKSVAYQLVNINAINCPAIAAGGYQKIVDLSATNMTFSANSGFYSLPTNEASGSENRGWVEINLDVQTGSGAEMETDSIRAQTIVSSRDYDWKEVN